MYYMSDEALEMGY